MTVYKIVDLLPRDRVGLRAIYAQERLLPSSEELGKFLLVHRKTETALA